MFVFGFVVGAAAATTFILYDNGELLVRLSAQLKKASERFWDAQKRGDRK